MSEAPGPEAAATSASAEDDQLGDWMLHLPIVLARLRDFYLPADFRFDCSDESLARLESLVLVQYPLTEAVAGAYVESVMAYLGECLLQVGGGHWVVGCHTDDPEQCIPLIHPDDALRRPPVSPLHLIVKAIGDRTGDVFVEASRELETAVAERRSSDRGWAPTVPDPAMPPDRVSAASGTTAGDPADDNGAAAEGETDAAVFLVRWLAERRRAFGGWTGDTSDPAYWDFSPESLDGLQVLLRTRLPGGGPTFGRPEQRDFVDGAVWYYGEAVRRAVGGQWDYIDGDPAASAWAGRPFIKTPGRGGRSKIPVYALMSAAESDNPQYLRQTLRLFD